MTRFGSRLVRAGALAIGLLRSAAAGAADAPRVLLVRPPGAAREVNIALIRVQGELVADGFEVVPVEADPGTTSEMAMTQAESRSASTTVGLFLSADGTNAELWVVDRLTNKTVVRRVDTAGQAQNQLPEVLAVRAVELLRASLLELVVERHRAAVPTATRAATQRASDWAERPLRRAEALWAIETGVAVLWSPSQVEPAFLSVARGRFALAPKLQGRLSFVGLGTRPEVRGTGGSATLGQWVGLAELLWLPFPDLPIRPALSLGAGAFHVAARGAASWPYQGLDNAQWAFAADAGIGLAVRLASRLELSVEGHALWAEPEPIVRFVNDDGPHVARPGIVGSLTLLGWL